MKASKAIKIAWTSAAVTLVLFCHDMRSLHAEGVPAPNALFYSGFLEQAGVPVDGTQPIQVVIWNSEDVQPGQRPLCQTGPTETPISGGRFRIALHSDCQTAVLNNNNTWVEVIVGATSLGRAKLGGVPYALEAQRATSATGELGRTLAELQQRVAALEKTSVPAGAVVAFDLATCPAGFTPHTPAQGRAVIGANPGGNGLAVRARGDLVGEEAHTLLVDEMPSHSHTHPIRSNVGSISNGDTNLYTVGGTHVPTTFGTSQPSNPTGGSKAFNNMQPSVALLYCRKT
jgi:hypothetical protein